MAFKSALYPRMVGIAVRTSLFSTTSRRTLCTSTTCDSPVTVIVSDSAPTRISTFTVNTPAPVSSMPSRFTVLKPFSVNVTS